MNYKMQFYKTIPLQLIKRFTINNTNQNVWIPNKHLTEDGTIIPNENIDYIFRKAQRQLELAGITYAIPGIKRRSK